MIRFELMQVVISCKEVSKSVADMILADKRIKSSLKDDVLAVHFSLNGKTRTRFLEVI